MSATWPSYEHVNVQIGVDAWLAEGAAGGERTHEVVGITGVGFMRHMDIGIGDLLQAGSDGPIGSAGAGGVTTTTLPAGPGGITRTWCPAARKTRSG